MTPARVALFASGGGTNAQAIIDHFRMLGGGASGAIVLVISDRDSAGALQRASAAGIAGVVIDPGDGAAIATLLREHSVDIIALAGYVRLVPREVTSAFAGRMLNVHPGPLPDFGGRGMYGERVHAAVIASGARTSAVTIHLVDEEYDRGATIARWPVTVLPADTPASLGARVLQAEHIVYPRIVDAVCAELIASRRQNSNGS